MYINIFLYVWWIIKALGKGGQWKLNRFGLLVNSPLPCGYSLIQTCCMHPPTPCTHTHHLSLSIPTSPHFQATYCRASCELISYGEPLHEPHANEGAAGLSAEEACSKRDVSLLSKKHSGTNRTIQTGATSFIIVKHPLPCLDHTTV